MLTRIREKYILQLKGTEEDDSPAAGDLAVPGENILSEETIQ